MLAGDLLENPLSPGHLLRIAAVFRLHALDSELELAAGADKDQLMQALEGHVLDVAELMGTYER